MAHLPVPGSHRHAVSGSFRVGDFDPEAEVEVTLVLRRPAEGVIEADPADLAAVQLFATVRNLRVVASHPEARAVTLSGSAAAMNTAFEVDLGEYSVDGQSFRGREGAVHVPEELHDAVVAVLGLDERPQVRHPHRVSPHASQGYTAVQVAQRYGFPTTGDGSGQTIGIIELGGGFRQSDLNTYFSALGMNTPSVTAIPVGGGKNSPGEDADVEVLLDIEVAGAVAPGANIAVYFSPNTTAGFYQCLASAINDNVRKPSVISISWGAPESSWTQQALTAYDALFADAAAKGITIFAASGDNGANDGTRSLTVDFPSSSPNVVACGGTTLTANGETVWNELSAGAGATGGGVSQFFSKPAYQANANVPNNPSGRPGRGVPDVSGNADPTTGYQIVVNGQWGVIGGTSAVAPLYAGLIAVANEINGTPAGAPHAKWYANPSAFNDIVSGNNAGYNAGSGWDASTGLGSPKGLAVVQALGNGAPTQPPPDDGTGTGTGSGGGTPTQPTSPGNNAVLLTLFESQQSAVTAEIAAKNDALTALNAAIAALKALGS